MIPVFALMSESSPQESRLLIGAFLAIGVIVITIACSMLASAAAGRQKKIWMKIAEDRGGSFVEEGEVQFNSESPVKVWRIQWVKDEVKYVLSRMGGSVYLMATVPRGVLNMLQIKVKGSFATAKQARTWTRYETEIEHSKTVDVEEFLTERVGKNLDRITRLDWSPGASMRVQHGKVTITKPSALKGEQSLRMFVNLAIPVIEQAIRVCLETGMDFLPDGAAGVTECQVCGDGLTTRIVNCVECGTGHHRECWEYAKSCSTYGCGSKDFREKAS